MNTYDRGSLVTIRIFVIATFLHLTGIQFLETFAFVKLMLAATLISILYDVSNAIISRYFP